MIFVIAQTGDSSGFNARRPYIEEKLGQMIPESIMFRDEKGGIVSAGRLTDKPAVVSLVYFSCTSICPLLLGNLAESIGKLDVDVRDFRIITLSFDDKDTPFVAYEKKQNYIRAIGRSFPETSWSFLTGDKENINKFAKAVGFEFRKEKVGFSHPRALIFLSRSGKIIRYLYGSAYSPFDIRMALAEATAEDRISAYWLARFCYSYDPFEKKYVFNTFRVFCTALAVVAVSFLAFISLVSIKIRRKEHGVR